MSRPWLRPEDGKFYLRKKTPARYREVAGKAEFRISLNTRDPKEAKARMPQALATWDGMVGEWERALAQVSLDEAGAKALASNWLSHLRRHGDPEQFGLVGPMDSATVTTIDVMDPMIRTTLAVDKAKEALALLDVPVSETSVRLVISAIEPWIPLIYSPGFWSEVAQERAFAEPKMQRDRVLRAMLDVSDLPVPNDISRSPRLTLTPQDRGNVSVVTFDAIWEAWSKVTATAPRTAHETRGILRQLAAFLGHDNAAQVSKGDLIRWRDALKAEGKSNNTWNNRLSLIGQVFKRALADDVLSVDPTAQGLRLEKSKGAPRYPYSDEEALAILRAARKETTPALRWSHWVMALSGMRVGEVLQLTSEDIAQDPKSGVWFMAVKHDPERGKAAKNSLPRNVPMHPSLVDEGFLKYALGVKKAGGDAPLFPDKKPDKYGRLGGRAWNLVGKWVRDKVGITEKNKAPNHSWRHRMEDELRAAEVDESIRDAIIGHARKSVGRRYGVQGEALARLHRELSKVQLPPGL